MSMIVALLTLPSAPAPAPCSYDRGAMLALSELSFDQDMTGGWRKLAYAGCEAQAADLIRDWRAAHAAEPLRNRAVSFWHEGQLRANLGQTQRAIALFSRSRKTAQEDAGFGWNHYVDGSIAFLRGDRTAFDAAYDRLATTPRPAGLNMTGPDGKPVAVHWPMNLNVLAGLRSCWGQPYRRAYACAVPIKRVDIPAS